MVINPIIGFYIPILRIPIKGGMTIPNIATFDHGTYNINRYIYLEHKWPLFWLEFRPSFGGFNPQKQRTKRFQVYILYYSHSYIPIGTMYGIFTYIYHKNQPFMQVNIPVPWIRHGPALDIGSELNPRSPNQKKQQPHSNGCFWFP